MMKNWVVIFLVLNFLCFSPVVTSGATFHFRDGGNHVVNSNHFDNTARLDQSIINTPGTRLDLVDGGVFRNIITHNNSILNINGGRVWSSLHAYDNSNITVSRGEIDIVIARYNGIINISGGLVTNNIQTYNNGTICFEGTDFEVNGQKLSYGDRLSDFVPLVTNSS